MPNPTHDEFDVDLTARTVTHRATGTGFWFHAYHTEADWRSFGIAQPFPTKDSPADLWPMARRAKAAAMAGGMAADRP